MISNFDQLMKLEKLIIHANFKVPTKRLAWSYHSNKTFFSCHYSIVMNQRTTLFLTLVMHFWGEKNRTLLYCTMLFSNPLWLPAGLNPFHMTIMLIFYTRKMQHFLKEMIINFILHSFFYVQKPKIKDGEYNLDPN